MAYLIPPIKFRVDVTDVDGYTVPLVGGKIYTYLAGTSTPKATYTSATLGTANANPVILDASGEADIWGDGSYKIIIKTAADATLATTDSIADLTSSATFTNSTLAGTLTISSTTVTWSGNPTHSGNHTWSGNQAFNGNVTIGDAGADTMTVNASTVTWPNTPTHSGVHTYTSGIKVGNAAQAGSTVLDWYEEGTFTPTLEFGGATTGITYTTRVGRYVRLGRLIHITIVIELSSKGSATGTSRITGLPFATYTTVSQLIGAVFMQMTGLSAPMVMSTNAGVATLFPGTATLATGTSATATDASFTNTSQVFVNSWYEVI